MKQLMLVRYFLFLVLLTMVAGCATMNLAQLETPQVALIDIKPRSSGALSLGFDIDLKITNPNGVSLPVKGIAYKVKVNGSSLVHGASNSVPTIPAYGSVDVHLSSNVNLLSAPKIVFDLMKSSTQSFSYELNTKIDLNGFMPSFNVVNKGQLPID